MAAKIKATRNELISLIANVDEEVGDLFIAEEHVSSEVLTAAVRRATVARTFVPVFMGSAFKNKGNKRDIVSYSQLCRQVSKSCWMEFSHSCLHHLM